MYNLNIVSHAETPHVKIQQPNQALSSLTPKDKLSQSQSSLAGAVLRKNQGECFLPILWLTVSLPTL